MSLSIDGTWKSGVWAETVWGTGVWFEGSIATSTTYSGGFLGHDKRKKKETVEYYKNHPWFYPIKKIEDIEPEIAEEVVAIVEKIVETKKERNQELDILLAQKKLKTYLKSQKEEWINDYKQLILIEYNRHMQELEDEQITMFLFEM